MPAEAELARRYLAAFGPATPEDLAWWAGWGKAQVERALATIEAVPVELAGGGSGMLLPDDLAGVPKPEPWAAVLPALDSTPMGWHERDWFLGEHGPRLFDRAGNIGPSLWWNGAIVGGWAQHKDGTVVTRMLTDIGSNGEAAVRREAETLSERIADVRLTARTRSRTWLEDELP